jgi:hypothetical protein
MALLKQTKKSSNKLIPVIGIDSGAKSFTKPVDNQYAQTAELAYYKAQARGFEPDNELKDWLDAEEELSQ